METDQQTLAQLGLADGEQIDSALNLTNGDSDDLEGADLILLTDRRIIHLNGNGKKRRAVFASIEDLDAVELFFESEGNGAYIWAGLAVIVAVLLFFVIDNATYRVIAAGVVALLGVYLVVDQLLAPGKPWITFMAGAAQFRCEIKSNGSDEEVYPFINRIFELKQQNRQSNSTSRASRFAPR